LLPRNLDSLEMSFNAAIDFPPRNTEYFQIWKVCDYIVVSFCKTVFAEHPVSEEDRDIIIQFYGH